MNFLRKVKGAISEYVGCEPNEATHVWSEEKGLQVFNNNTVNNIPSDNNSNEQVPEPLGIPTMNFEKKEEQEKTIENNNGTPEGLPIPAMTF